MDFSIRKGTVNDLQQIRSIFHETVQAFDRTHYTETQVKQWMDMMGGLEKWQTKLCRDKYVVAENKKKEVVGFSSLQDNGCIDMLYVMPTAQKNGIATKLLNSICDIADSAALPLIHIEASLAAVLFFEKNGFQVNCANAKDVGGVHFTKIHLVKKLCVM
jgi:putative acetyltransferase